MLKVTRRLLLLFACLGLVLGMPLWEAAPCCPCGPEEAEAAVPDAAGSPEQHRCTAAGDERADDCADGCLSCCVCCHAFAAAPATAAGPQLGAGSAERFLPVRARAPPHRDPEGPLQVPKDV